MRKKNTSFVVEETLDIVSTVMALAWAGTMLLRIGFKPVLQYSFAATSFMCYAVLVLFVLKEAPSRVRIGQLFATILILIAGLLAAPEAHRIMWNQLPLGLAVLILIDLSVLFLLSMSVLFCAPDPLRKFWQTASKRIREVFRSNS